MQCKLIELLKKNQGFLSGQEISRRFNMSRAGVWKNIQELRKAGYLISAVPNCGYRLQSSPDKLFSQELNFELGTKFIGRQVIYQERVVSTMDEASRLAAEGASEGTVVCSETQTRGRGRMGRQWSSPKGQGIYLSLILRPNLSLLDVSKMTLLTAVAVCEAIRGQTSVDARIKWPNDILIRGRKVAGILTELNAELDRVKSLVIGLGINVNTSADRIPDPGTSLKIVSGKNVSRVRLTQEFFRAFEKWYVLSQQQGFDLILKRWEELSCTIGQKISVVDAGKTVTGQALGLAEDGGLLIRVSPEETVKKMSGDVFLADKAPASQAG